MLQSPVEKTSDGGATVPSLVSRLDTATVTAAVGRVSNATVNVACPPASVAGPLTAPSVSPSSSSRRVRATPGGAATPRPPTAVADTPTVLSAADTALSTAVTVTRPALVVAPGAIVSVVPACVKSPATAPTPGDAATVTVTASLDGCESVAVTVLTPPFSVTDDGVSTSAAFGSASSSGMARVTAGTPPTVAETVTDLSGASTVLSTAVTVTVPALVVAPGAIVSVVVELSVKSPATAGGTAAAVTVTVTASPNVSESVAVTVLTPPPSETEAGDSTNAGATSGIHSVMTVPRFPDLIRMTTPRMANMVGVGVTSTVMERRCVVGPELADLSVWHVPVVPTAPGVTAHHSQAESSKGCQFRPWRWKVGKASEASKTSSTPCRAAAPRSLVVVTSNSWKKNDTWLLVTHRVEDTDSGSSSKVVTSTSTFARPL